MDQEPPSTRKWEQITQTELAEVDAALAKTNGNRAHAAAALGMERYRLENLINNRPELRGRWAKVVPQPVSPGALADLERPGEPLPLSAEQHKAVDAILRQDALLQKGWERMGVSEKDREFLQALQLQYATNLRGTMDLAFGGAAHATTCLLLMLEDVRRKIAHIDEHPDEYHRYNINKSGAEIEVKGPMEYRKEYYDTAVRIASELRKMSKDTAENNKLRLVMAKMAADQAGAEKKKTAGWQPGVKPAPKVTEASDADVIT